MNDNRSQHIYVLQVARPEMLTGGPSPQEAAILDDHVSYLDRLSKAGAVLLAGRTQTADASTFGLVILARCTEAEGADIMAADPAVAGGVMTARLYPYRTAFVSPDIVNAS